jgi:hypothetical protein
MSERQYYGDSAWGMELGSGRPEGLLASEHKATPARVAAASQLFEQASLSDFQAVGSTGRRFRHRESGCEYMVAQEQVLMERDPRRSGVEYFVIAGDRLLFLRPRGFDAVERGVPGEIISGELRRSPSGGVQVVDPKSGAVLREQVRL